MSFRKVWSTLAFILVWRVCHHASALVNQDGVHQSRSTERSSMSTTILPILPKSTDEGTLRQSNVKRHFKDERSSNDGDISSSIPDRIPRLSEVMQENSRSLDGAKKTRNGNGHSKNKRRANNNNGTRKNKPSNLPWRAGFKASLRTQGRIKKVFMTANRRAPPNVRAKKILNTLLATPPKQCNAANIVCALTYSAKVMGMKKIRHPDEELRKMLFQTLDVLHELVMEKRLNTRQLANACWAIAKHFDRDDALLPKPPAVSALSSDSMMGTAETWNMMESNSKEKAQQQRVSETLDEIAMQIISIMEETDEGFHGFSPQSPKIGELCMTSWAYGILRHRNIPPGWQVPPQISKVPSSREAAKQANSNIMTFEKWNSFGDDMKQDDWSSTDSNEITDNLFDAMAYLLSSSPEVDEINEYDEMDEIQGPPRTFLEQCTWSELANLGWAFASRGSCRSAESEKLLVSLAREARYRIKTRDFPSEGLLIRDVAQLLWSLGTLQADNFRLADDLVCLVEALSEYLRLDPSKVSAFGRGRPLRRWSCADIVQVTLSLSHARIDEMPLLRAVYSESNYRLVEGLQEGHHNSGDRRQFYSWEVSILLWAQARLYLNSSQGTEFKEFADHAPETILQRASHGKRSLSSVGIGPQEQANIAWALTVLEQHQSADAIKLIDQIFQEAASECQEQKSIQLEHAHQLWQAYFLLEGESPEAVRNVPDWFSDYLHQKWSLEKARDKLSSARHRALSQTLLFMGVEHYNEHDEDIDVAIVLKGNAEWTHETEGAESASEKVNVAVEFDGPNHFTRERENGKTGKPVKPRALGHTVLKYRLLRKQGWTVVRVPYFEFDKIPFWASMVSSIQYVFLVLCGTLLTRNSIIHTSGEAKISSKETQNTCQLKV